MHQPDFRLPIAAVTSITLLANAIQSSVDHRLNELQPLLGEYQTLFESVGDMAYGKFNALLFLPARHAIAEAGLKAVPRLPGSFQSSREWGNADETHQQRWMLSKMLGRDGRPLGTIAVGNHHDHSAFRLPRSPEIIGLLSTAPKDVTAELSRHHPEFGAAEEFREWYASYLAAQAGEGRS
ncbi:DUF6022 family protein (plasmid) [Devosia neptuniae]|uniref:DUF6022 family protein n=1 Tax=Devosia neptuniae TaxID=191302 RepID=A0ABY6C6N3_9HYPH|nr:DUF6022 family protein [Devosia neptuniae]UXN67802.1 DUF6022 family protein [Devosia neptuniae]